MMRKWKIYGICCIIIILILNYLILYNVHISPISKYEMIPTRFNISEKCDWENETFDFNDYKPESFEIISKFLEKLDTEYNIKSIIRDGSFLHTFRQRKADMDMDIYMIIPNELTFVECYVLIKSLLNNKRLKFEHQNMLLTSIFWDKSDAVRISYDGKKIVDINVLHESFINDKKLQIPCFEQMKCDDKLDEYLEKNIRYIKTNNLFENLCKCNYMGSSLYCFNSNAAKYLEIRYGKNFRIPIEGDNSYDLIYERPKGLWRWIIRKFPFIFEIKYLFEGHRDESNHFNKD